MAEMGGVLLMLLYMSHSSSAICGIQKANITDQLEENLVSSTEFPWVVSIQDKQYTHLAFGCILSKFWILSTASALRHRKNVIAVVGISNMDPRQTDYREYSINTIIPHEDFNNHSMKDNIALLKTDSAMHFSDLVQAICFLGKKLPKPPALENCWVAGWNPTSADHLLGTNSWALRCMVQTGNHMTMSILRRISVKDIQMCPLHRQWKTECASHTKEPNDVCLGEPGSPMMCQVKKFDLWILRGLLAYGSDSCPGRFLYTSVEDYSDWITAVTRKAGPSLSSLHLWENMASELPFHQSNIALTKNSYSVHSSAERPPSYSRGQSVSTTYKQRDAGQNFRVYVQPETGRPSKVAVQPMYYDYYGGEAVEGGAVAGQNRLRWSQERILMSFVLVFLGSGV